MASPMATMALIGARLARLTSEPDMLITDGEALLADTPAVGAKARSRAGCRSGGCSTSWPRVVATS